jgi:hypothetical protein
VDSAGTEAVIPKGLEWQWAEGRLLLSKHRGGAWRAASAVSRRARCAGCRGTGGPATSGSCGM